MRRLLAILVFGLALGLPPAVWAAAPPAPTNEDCLGCHQDEGLAKTVKGKAVSLFADPAILRGSVHGPLQCVDCHAGIKEIPHPEALPRVSCGGCHDEPAKRLPASIHGAAGMTCQACHGTHGVKPATQLAPALCRQCHQPVVQAYQEGVHGRAVARGVAEAAKCRDCHGASHEVRAQADPAAPTARMHMAETCGRCHADRALVERRQIPIPQAYQLYQKSVHGRAVAAGRAAASCNDCHASHDIRRATDSRSRIYRENIPKTCGACHAQEAKVYLESIHGTAMLAGASESPVCIDCHGEHSIRGTQDPDSPVSVGRVTRTCASCHDVQRITEKYGLPAGRLATYADSYHGLAARGGSLVAANCASCHGFHDIRPSRDPRSSVSPANLPATCGKCHPGAGANFARGAIHVALTAADAGVLAVVRRFYLLTIVVTIAGMLLHNGLDFFGKLRRHYRRRGGAADLAEPSETTGEAERFYLRMTLAERWQHGLLAMSFLVLVYTGFALKFPDTWLFAWLAGLERGYAWRSLIHRTAAVVMLLAGLFHLVYLPTRRGRGLLADMLPRLSDLREAVQNVGYLLGLRAERPAFDRFSYIEKVEYWALIWGSAVMAVTGFALWFENRALQLVPKWVLDLATLVHYYEAWLASLAILVWHFYFVIFSPDVYPMNWTWLTGRIPEEMLRHEHPREYARLGQEEAPQEPEPPRSRAPGG